VAADHTGRGPVAQLRGDATVRDVRIVIGACLETAVHCFVVVTSRM
jgi:hypothetical protein